MDVQVVAKLGDFVLPRKGPFDLFACILDHTARLTQVQTPFIFPDRGEKIFERVSTGERCTFDLANSKCPVIAGSQLVDLLECSLETAPKLAFFLKDQTSRQKPC